MASIGPQIPLHLLQKRQEEKGADERGGSESSATESEGNPRAPLVDTSESTVVGLGPVLPSAIAAPVSKPDSEQDESDEDDYGPALPPDLITTKAEKQKRVVGPSLPGSTQASGSSEKRESLSEESDDDDDDGYGPMPLPSNLREKEGGINEGVREFLEKEERRKKMAEEAAKPKELKREEWMLVPPSSSDLLGRLGDPTKLKARQFTRGGSSAARSGPNNLWTETPAEKQQRIADEIAGKKRRAANADEDSAYGGDEEEKVRKRRRDEDIRKVVENHNKTSRAKTLLEMHESDSKSKKGKDNKDDEPPAIWDHSRDMAIGGRLMDEKQRQKMISDARSLGDRFGSGKGGGFL